MAATAGSDSTASSGSSSSSTTAPKVVSLFSNSSQITSVKLDRTNYLLWESVALSLIRGNDLEEHIEALQKQQGDEDDVLNGSESRESPTANNPTDIISSSRESVPCGKENDVPCGRQNDNGNSPFESRESSSRDSPNNSRGSNTSIAGGQGIQNNNTGQSKNASVEAQDELETNPSQPIRATHQMVTRAKAGIHKPKYPFVVIFFHLAI
ncbi:uncharacterized protein G2W53_001451 [Senna tora]|uniref:Retrotransposon Copia-like N-terminal domain-containing protein n=1 Tax=Senna tora TaxID=362788 RepID=A0A835CKB8_9FABA|nr:uncharacterized protein G2W53_001451 [Senna tora]